MQALRPSAGCVAPRAVTWEDLMAAADGEAPSHLAEHLHACTSCAAEVRALAVEQRRLRHALYRFECPTPHTLGEYTVGVLETHEQRLVAAHAADCPRCAEELKALRTFLSVEPERAPGVVDRIRRTIATLLPPAGALAHATLRGGGRDAAQSPAVYRAGDLTISVSLDVESHRGSETVWAITGLLSAEGGAAAPTGRGEVRLVEAGGTSRAAPVDTLGNFSLEGIGPGTYRLEVALADQLAVIEEVRVGDD